MNNLNMDEVRALQLVVENATLRERKRCHELAMRLYQNTDDMNCKYIAEAIKCGLPVPKLTGENTPQG